MLFSRLPGKRIENVGKVRCPFFNGPVFHDRRHGIGYGRVHTLAEFNGFAQRAVHGLGQALPHDAIIEHVATEDVRGPCIGEIERSRFGFVGGDGLDGAVSGGFAAHYKPRVRKRGDAPKFVGKRLLPAASGRPVPPHAGKP